MKQRCQNPKNPDFPNYGGRGIAVCERWKRYANFKADMGSAFRPGLFLERKNNNRGYSPTNCCWATLAQQARNSRQNRWLSLNGVRLCITDWARRLGLERKTIDKRLSLGWPIEHALTAPINQKYWHRIKKEAA